MPFAATWMELETLILSEMSQKDKDKYHMISLNTWNLKHGTNEAIYETETDSQTENRVLVAEGEEEGAGWLGILGLIDTHYCLWNGLAMRSCCVALGIMSSHLR